MSRNKIDILYFIRYRLRIFPVLIMDKVMNKYRINMKADESYPKIINKSLDPMLEVQKISPLGESIIKDGKVILLGKDVNMGWPPKWETPETGIWPKDYSENIKFYGDGIDNDIKLVWELHRLQWLPSVAAYSIKIKNKELNTEIIDVMIDYINNHPKNKTISWMEGIEITLRSISIIETLSYLKDEIIEDSRISIIHHQLVEYAKWIDKNLSQKWRLNNNHLILELIGLIIIGTYLDWHPKSKYWKNKAIKLLDKEIKLQTIDGRNWEPTTAYHRFVTESLLVMSYYTTNMNFNNRGEMKDIKEVLQKSVEVLKFMSIGKDENMPLIGDDDAGIVLPRELDMDFRSNLRVLNFSRKLGYKFEKNNYGVRFWEDQGMGIIQNKQMMIHFVTGAPKGKYRQGSHRHIDMLSLSISVENEEIILDSGTGLYFGNKKMRDFFRSEESHSGIYSKNYSWAELNNLFEVKNPPIGDLRIEENKIFMSCLHPSGITQRRNIEWHENNIEINDPLDLKNPVICFIVKDIGHISTNEGIWEMRGKGWRMTHRPMPDEIKISSTKDKNTLKTKDTLYSPSYGIIKTANRIEFLHQKGVTATTQIWID